MQLSKKIAFQPAKHAFLAELNGSIDHFRINRLLNKSLAVDFSFF